MVFVLFFVGFVVSIFWAAAFCDCGSVAPRESAKQKRIVAEKWTRKQRKSQQNTKHKRQATRRTNDNGKDRTAQEGGGRRGLEVGMSQRKPRKAAVWTDPLKMALRRALFLFPDGVRDYMVNGETVSPFSPPLS